MNFSIHQFVAVEVFALLLSYNVWVHISLLAFYGLSLSRINIAILIGFHSSCLLPGFWSLPPIPLPTVMEFGLKSWTVFIWRDLCNRKLYAYHLWPSKLSFGKRALDKFYQQGQVKNFLQNKLRFLKKKILIVLKL